MGCGPLLEVLLSIVRGFIPAKELGTIKSKNRVQSILGLCTEQFRGPKSEVRWAFRGRWCVTGLEAKDSHGLKLQTLY